MQRQNLLAMAVAIMVVALAGSVRAQSVPVNCDAGESLAAAVAASLPGATIAVTGTCQEKVTISTDRLTLDGGGTAILDGTGLVAGDATQPDAVLGLLNVVGARGVRISGLAVQNSPENGISVQQGAAATIQNVTVRESTDNGIQVQEAASIRLVDSTLEGSVNSGLLVSSNSHARLYGEVVSQDNGLSGISAVIVSSVAFISGTIEASFNGGNGIQAVGGSSILVDFSGPTVNANENAGAGFALFEAAHMSVVGGVVSAALNGSGMAIFDKSIFSATGGAVTLSSNVEFGMLVVSNSSLLAAAPGTFTLQGNLLSGLASDFGSVVDLSGGATITGNGTNGAGPDLEFAFASTVNIGEGNTLGGVLCDASVLIRSVVEVVCLEP